MAFNILGTLSQGLSRTVARNGLLFIGLYFGVGIVSTVLFPGLSPDGTGMDPIVTLPVGVAVVLYVLIALANMMLHIGAIRTFVTPETKEISPTVFTRNLLPVVIYLFIGSLLVGIAVGVGLVLLILPGLFLLTALFFYDVFITVEDETPLQALRKSWSLTSGHRLRLFALGILVFGLVMVVSGLFALLGESIGGFASALLVGAAVAIGGVFIAATTAQAYLQLQSLDTAVEASYEKDDDPDERGVVS